MPKRFNILLLAIVVAFITLAMYILPGAPKTHHKISYLALGDSYTIGYKIRYAENYPNQIAGMLREQNMDVADPVIIAYPGWTTTDLERGIDEGHVSDTFSFVTLLIGNNDRNQGWSVDMYRSQFEQLLCRAIKFTAGHPEKVFVLSIPDISINNFEDGNDKNKIAQGIKDYNVANKEITLAHKCRYIDITYSLRDHVTDTEYYLSDWVHPTSKGYAILARQIVPVIAETLK